jgi:hypothetical protein
MKSILFFASVCISLTLTSCYQNSDEDLTANDKFVTFNLNATGVEQSSLTRAISEPGNLLIIDILGDNISTEIKSSLASFGLPLEYGTHEIYFVAATSIWSAYDTSELTVTWPSTHSGLSYVWAYHLTLEVDENTSVEEINLPLVIANVKLSMLDKIPSNVVSLKFDAPDLCKGLDLKTMTGFLTDTPVNNSLDVSNYAGKTLSVNMFTFVPSTGYVGDIVITAFDSNSEEIASQTLSGVPVQKGYITKYSGYFFSDGVTIPLTYSTDWTGTNNYSF